MKFDVVVGNPPYQGEAKQQIYTDFYVSSLGIANNVCLIFPTGWQEPKSANNLKKMNTESIKRDKQILFINNVQNVFKGIPGAEWTNVILWKRGYDNRLDGKQRLMTNDAKGKHVMLPINKKDLKKPYFIEQLKSLVINRLDFEALSHVTSSRKPYGLSSDVMRVDIMDKYNLPELTDTPQSNNDTRVVSPSGFKYAYPNYPFAKISNALHSYKVLIPYAWGNMDEKNGLGGAYADLMVASPNDACTETYLECGNFDSETDAACLAKFLLTRFARALLYANKYSQHSTTAFGAIPQQDFSEDWWDLSIEEINEKLFDKYDIPQDVRKQVNVNIQKKDESNIITL